MTDHDIDRFVGRAIAERRKALGLSQSRLAAALDVTFQQVHKYERAINRVSAPELWRCAVVLEVASADLFPPLKPDPKGCRPTDISLWALDEAPQHPLTSSTGWWTW